MAAGSLRARVTFQAASRVSDGGGGSSITWVDALVVWGAFRPERGSERLGAGRIEASLAGVLRVRATPTARTITTAHSVLIGGVAYQIRSIANPDQRNRYLEMVVERGVAQ